MKQIEQILDKIRELKKEANVREIRCDNLKNKAGSSWYDAKVQAYNEILALFDDIHIKFALEPIREYPSSTELIRLWEDEVLPMLKEKDFRGDAQRMAYNAYLEGFARGLSCKPLEKNLANYAKSSKDLKEPTSEDLEKAARDYRDKTEFQYPNQLQPAYEGFKVGAQWQKEQMMKDAIEGMVNSELGTAITTNNKGTVLTERFNLENLHIGDKVKVIILKK